MKKICYLFLCIILLVSCKKNDTDLKIVVSNYILYDWLTEFSKGSNNKIIILDSNSNTDNYDFAIYNGDGSDDWFYDKIKDKDSLISIVDLMKDDNLDCCSKENKCCVHKGHCCYHSDKTYVMWNSIDFIKKICDNISNCLINMDSKNSDLYKKNLVVYKDKLNELNKKLESGYDKIVFEAFSIAFIEDVTSSENKKNYINLMNEYISEMEKLNKKEQ